MSEGDDKQDDKTQADAEKAPASSKPGPVRKATIVGMAPVGGTPASRAPASRAPASGARADKAKGTLLGMAPVSDEEVAADKQERLAAPPAEKPAAAEKPATDEPATDEPATDEPATDEPATDEPATDEPAAEKPATEKPATEKPATEKPAAEKPAAEKPATEKPATEKPATEKPAADEPAADEPAAARAATEPSSTPALYLAEFETPNAIVHAAERVRDAGYTKWDCHTPYALHGLDQAMGLAPTRIGVISFVFGLTGVLTAFLLMYCTNGMDDSFMGFAGYRAVVGGKPPGAFPSMVPIMFELGILLCGLSTLFGLLGIAKLPRHHHPVFSSERFARATDDRYFISIEAADEHFDLDATRALLESTEPSFLELVEEDA